METAGGLPGTAEVLRESGRTRVTRVFLPGRTIVRKQPLGPDAERRLRQERAVLERLLGIPGVVQPVDEPRYPGAISLVDLGGPSLATVPAPLDAEAVVRIGSALAGALAGMHRRGVLHRDITPANVVLSRDGTPCLVGFGRATPLAEIRPEFTHHTEIVGTLAYLAPEQTGRTGRSVDQRADLYALGATLYELATGAPPFGSGDPLRLSHDHLARIPVPPAEVNPTVPEPLSEIILHLLEKEPDSRYQSADGLLHDLQRLRDSRPGPAAAPVPVGRRDVPMRLLPPSRLVGRDAEVAALEEAFDDALTGRCRAVLVSGAPGVGKTALIDELRPVVTRAGGWFVAGKFDQYRRDLESSGVYRAFRTLARLLLAEPEDELVEARERMRAALGANAGLMAAVIPEYGALLAVPPDTGDPITVQMRGQRNGVEVLRAVAAPERPIVLFLDDLQWVARTPLGFVDLLLEEDPIAGLLVVCAYREDAADGAHPLAGPLSRWPDRTGVRLLRLANLTGAGLARMVAEMLHVDQGAAAELAELVGPHTAGNPYETVELLNALRREGVLTATDSGWRWDPATARDRLDRANADGALPAPAAAMPERSRQLVEAMACLGGRATVNVLQTATGEPADVLEGQLAPALDEGVLVVEPGAEEAVRFRHDRIQEAIVRGLTSDRRRDLHLTMARRLARVPDLSAVAAGQYLPVVDALDDRTERQQVAGLLRHAAAQARTIAADNARASTLLGATLTLIDPGETATLVAVHTDRQAALYGLGRLDEADEEYRAVEALRPTAVQRAEATAMQVHSLTHRNRFVDAVALGVGLLRELGIAVPPDPSAADVEDQIGHLYRWLERTGAVDDLARPELTDPVLLAAAGIIGALVPALFFVPEDFSLFLWLTLQAPRIWLEHGPARSLVGPTGVAANAATVKRDENYAAGYRAMGRVVALGDARGYEPDTSLVRASFGGVVCWFEPIENAVREAARAREGLIAGGDLAWAGYTYHTSVVGLLECAPTLDVFVAEVDAGLAFIRRTGNEQTGQWLDSYRWLAAALRGEGGPGTPAAAAPMPVDRHAGNPSALLHAHIDRAIAAAILGDDAGLARHSAAAMPLLPAARGHYPTALARLLRGLSLAGRARAGDPVEREALVRELAEVTAWLAARAADAPVNFLHLVHLLEAERAWAVGDFRAAVLAFDAALREVADRQRPWHRALITERAARFHLAHGAEHAGRELLARAREAYAAWGATAKVARLDWAYPALREAAGPVPVEQRPAVTTGTLDLLGVLSASQALSSETSIERLHARIVEVLSTMTGATRVQLVLWSDDEQDWLAPPGTPAGALGAPASVLRYVQRVGEPLVLGDATRDDRFARDPYFAGVEGCSLLAVPLVGRGALRAVLLLENRLLRGAFTAERLDAVTLIAAQLTVSLDNAQLYAELTASRARIVAAADQTRRRIERDLHDGAQQRLVSVAIQARMAKEAGSTGSAELAARLDAIATEADTAVGELRELARGIHPAALTEGGLGPALRVLARRCTVPVRLDVRVGGRLPEQVEIATYFAVAEMLTNTAKHAEATAATVDVGAEDGVLRIRVTDDGRGGADLDGGSGLIGVKDRVEALGGRVWLTSARGAGTTVRAELPLGPAT